MRFKTRYDAWLVIVLIAAGVISLGVPLALYFTQAARGGQLWLFIIAPLVLLMVLSLTLPQYYELRDGEMFIRQGWKKVLLPYSALCELRAEKGVLSAPVFSTQRIYLTAAPGGQFILALAEEDRFLAEVERRAPQLKRVNWGLESSRGSPVRL